MKPDEKKAQRRFLVGIRKVKGTAERNHSIVEAVKNMEGYSEIARRFGISRQRVEQIFLNHNHLAVDKRQAALNKFIKPYLAVGQKPSRCALCGQERETLYFLCHECRRALGIITSIKTQLRGYAKSKDRLHLMRASYLIRKHGVKPEDLKFI